MALVVGDRVQETTITVGTGTVALLGPVPQFQSFASAIGNGNSTYYTIADQSGTNWEEGIGTYTASGSTLSRNVVLSSSNANALVSFGTGNKNVFCSYPPEAAVLAAPTSYPQNIPSLSLDFVNSKSIDPRITFLRNSPATYYDGKTTVMAEQNLLTYSQDFSNAAWTKPTVTLTPNSTTAPDGTVTATTMTTTAGTSAFYMYPATNTISIGVLVTLSGYFKANTNNYVQLTSLNAPTTGYANFDLSLGVLGSVGAGTTASITSAGNGWYRCVITFTTTDTANARITPYIVNSASVVRALGFTAVGTESIYMWGAQAESRSSATAYTPTTTTAITNYIPQLMTAPINTPRLDYNPTTGQPLGLLIEEARTNLLTYSQSIGSTGWSNNVYGIATQSSTLNSGIAPDGTQTATNYIFRLNGSTSTADYVTATQFSIAVTSGTSYTASIWAKTTDSSTVIIGFRDDGTAGTYNANITVTPTWQRFTLTGTAANTISNFRIWLRGGLGQSNYANILVWGAQLEAGSFATSYIPTTTTTSTRAGDRASITGTNFSSWYNPSQGTLYCEVSKIGQTSNNAYYAFLGSSGYGQGFRDNGAFLVWQRRAGLIGTGDASFSSTLSVGVSTKMAASYVNSTTGASTSAVSNGGAVTSYSTYPLATPYYLLAFYDAAGSTSSAYYIKRVLYYPQVLSSANLQALTSN